MLPLFAHRKARKIARELLRQAVHLRNMRQDLFNEAECSQLTAGIDALRSALSIAAKRSPENTRHLADASDALNGLVMTFTPAKWRSTIRENLEVLVVAVAVAMAFRAYFLQPFKIPTGSMQPTLYGIHSVTHDQPGLFDRLPLNYLKLAITGRWYREIHADASGSVPHLAEDDQRDPSIAWMRIGGVMHRFPKDALQRKELNLPSDGYIRKGDVLWTGEIIRGDHLFVNKIVYNFRKPRRGDVMVFNTSNIEGLPPGTHYIKRTVGLPGEQVQIHSPNLLINGVPVYEPEMIGRIARAEDGYDGYQLVDPRAGIGILRSRQSSLHLGPLQYCTFGDNTHNSLDSRYWGTVPAVNVVGPASIVYWPLSRRWGRIR